MAIIKKRKRLVVENKVKICELTHSSNYTQNYSLRRENERIRLLNLKIPTYIDEDAIQ